MLTRQARPAPPHPSRLAAPRSARAHGVAAIFALLFAVIGCDHEATDAASAPDDCSADIAEGTEVGDRVPPFVVRQCDGTEISLHDLVCGQPLTLIDVGSAAYPGCIEATRTFVSDPDFAALREDGLRVVQIFTSDSELQRPSDSFCQRYVRRHGIEYDFLIDPPARTDAFSPRYPLNLVVDGRGVILHKWSPAIPPERLELLRAALP